MEFPAVLGVFPLFRGQNSGGPRDTPANILCQQPQSPTTLNLTAKTALPTNHPPKLDGGVNFPITPQKNQQR